MQFLLRHNYGTRELYEHEAIEWVNVQWGDKIEMHQWGGILELSLARTLNGKLSIFQAACAYRERYGFNDKWNYGPPQHRLAAFVQQDQDKVYAIVKDGIPWFVPETNLPREFISSLATTPKNKRNVVSLATRRENAN
ncbi:MAG: hypothetical protein GJ680_18105 [Alteromonadaceae bacterium]|nr:hypothetical protein [Alteromonadaceae bacterium]